MSRVGKKPVPIPSGVQVDVHGNTLRIKGPKGEMNWECPAPIGVTAEAQQISVQRRDDARNSRALHGMSRALIANMIHGVHHGYEKRLLIYGTGYGCNVNSGRLELNVGFMGRGINKRPQFSLPIPDGVEVHIETPAARGDSEPAKLVVRGIDKQKVGQFAAEIRALRKPEPYKGKGVRYEKEHVRRKQGKAFAAGG